MLPKPAGRQGGYPPRQWPRMRVSAGYGYPIGHFLYGESKGLVGNGRSRDGRRTTAVADPCRKLWIRGSRRAKSGLPSHHSRYCVIASTWSVNLEVGKFTISSTKSERHSAMPGKAMAPLMIVGT